MKEIIGNIEIKKSIALAMKHWGLVSLMSLGGISHFIIYLEPHVVASYLNNIFLIIALFLTPIIYGIFTELIKGNEYKIIDVCKKYIIRYFLVILLIYSPKILFILVQGTLIKNNIIVITHSVQLVITIFSIYILPFTFLTGQVLPSIAAGLLMLIKEFKNNLDLVALSLIHFITSMLAKGYIFKLLNSMNLFVSTIAFLLFALSVAISLIIFISALSRLKARALVTN